MNASAARGAALLLVLWLLVLLSGLIAVFALTARTEALQGSALRTQVAGRHAAEAGIELAAFRMAAADPAARWVPDGRANEMAFEGWALRIAVLDEAGKFDLNAAEPVQLARLMVVLGVEPARADQLAGAIQDWRDADVLVAMPAGVCVARGARGDGLGAGAGRGDHRRPRSLGTGPAGAGRTGRQRPRRCRVRHV